MFKRLSTFTVFTVHALAFARLAGSPEASAAAQAVPPLVLYNEQTARGALQEANTALRDPVNSRSRDQLLSAIQKFLKAVDDLATLDYTGLQDEIRRSRALHYAALKTLLEVMTARCEQGSVPDELAAGDILRVLDDSARQGIGPSTLNALINRVLGCLALDLKIDSRITDVKSGFIRHVEVRVRLNSNLAAGMYSGESVMIPLLYSVPSLQGSVPSLGGKCSVSWPGVLNAFTVQRLKLERDSDFVLRDVVLDQYDPGEGMEVVTLSFPPGGKVAPFPRPTGGPSRRPGGPPRA
ncbi:hypothetical protein E7T06_17760 [Deinococcus sp. Arct2-2]|uniref:hypothetical protein n=1 Tax=Deinococcus sp. Arct2-2 TaxID=2568653 RepID=UPI0010A42E0F|nr:hypothetical protein [Deinococcus sp. Arct2-2]THF68180.1 hypothetical protein E7T06_17760 [Deinococcus sp. Arct2-2]